ncbi:MAG: shikimate dehydrogenase [Bacteroidetes bacterium]|nr:shikimate dehydrogenase [Bacteroidota bacterium]
MKLYGLIGYPLGHSFSKQYFTEKFIREQITDCSFELFPISHIDRIGNLIKSETNLQGLAVTIPYKEAVLPFLYKIDPVAEAVGAVNCIRIIEGKCYGYNTDSTGFEQSLSPLLKASHPKALVLGSGGSSKAVQYVLTKKGIEFLIVTSSDKHTGKYIQYRQISEALLQEYPVIINCTPVGMSPNVHEYPQLPYEFLSEKNLLFDLIYSPSKTKFLQLGEERGATVKNGFEMLVLQAEENWKIWNAL